MSAMEPVIGVKSSMLVVVVVLDRWKRRTNSGEGAMKGCSYLSAKESSSLRQPCSPI
jgi:hypothetical protein